MLKKLVLIVSMCAQASLAGTYYVAPGGQAANPGTEAQPWPDVNTALSKVGGSHLILVKPGVYPAFSVTVSGSVTSPGKWAVIRSTEKWRAVIATTGTNAITVKGPYTSIEGFDVSGAASNGIKVEADNVTVKNCWVHNTTTGIYAPGRNGVTLEMNYLDQCNDGIYASGTRVHVASNICWNNKRYGINCYPAVDESGVYTNIAGINGTTGIRVAAGSKNRVVQNTVCGSPTGIDLGTTAQGSVANNLVAECRAAIVGMTSASGNSIHHNVTDLIRNMAGVATINDSPLFVQPGDLPLALRLGSPAIGQGDYSLAPFTDLLGQKINPNRVDCGAVQYNPRLEGACPCPSLR